MLERLFFELVENIDRVVSEKNEATVLANIARQFDLAHVAYLGINIPEVKEKTFITTTYSEAWVHRYVSQDYVSIDPIVQVGLRGILPLDWKDVREANQQVKSFFGEASEFGVARQGLSIPIRGVHGETAMFSINIDRSEKEWPAEKKKLMRDFQILAYHFHTRLLEKLGVAFPDVSLIEREKECLKWTAAGKTSAEIGMILSLSERTVRYHLECARTKLGTVNSAQALARAIRLNLI